MKKYIKFFIVFALFTFFGEKIVFPDYITQQYKTYLISNWKFNENRSVIVGDSQPNANHGLIKGNNYEWTKDSVEGSALHLEGNTYVEVEHSDSLSFKKDFTISCWFLADNVAGKSKIISKRKYSNEFAFFLIGIENSKIYAGVGNGKEVSLIPKEKKVLPGIWHFVVFVYDSRHKKIKLFLDGEKVSEADAISSFNTGRAKLAIGADFEGQADYFKGIVDEISIFNTAIPDKDIIEAAKRSKLLSIRLLTPGQIEARRRAFLVGYWDFDIGYGSVIRDRSGHENNGLLKNMGPKSWKQSFIGSNVDFDGTDDYMLVKHSESLNLRRGFTLSAWIYPKKFGERRKIISKRTKAYKYNFYLIGEDQGRLYAGVGDGENITLTPKMTSLKLNKWQHIAATLDLYKGKLTLYLNGNKVEEVDCSHIADSKNANLTVGAGLEGNEGFFCGMVDEVRIYSIALPQMSIKNIYDKDYLRYKLLEEEREKLKKIKLSIEEYKLKLIKINEKLGVLEEIGEPEKGKEEEFLNLLKKRLKIKKEELAYRKKVKITKIMALNKEIENLTQMINSINEVLGKEKIPLRKINESQTQSLKQLDERIKYGNKVKEKLNRRLASLQDEIKTKLNDLKANIRDITKKIEKEKSLIRKISKEFQVGVSLPTFYYEPLPKTEPEFKRIFHEQNEKKNYLQTLINIRQKLEAQLEEKKKRYKKLLKENREKLKKVVSQLSDVCKDLGEKPPYYLFGGKVEDWLPKIIDVYNKESRYYKSAVKILEKKKKERDSLIKEYTAKLKKINKELNLKIKKLIPLSKELGLKEEKPVYKEYIPVSLKDLRDTYNENSAILDAINKKLYAYKMKLEKKKREEKLRRIKKLQNKIKAESSKINELNAELGISERIFLGFEGGKKKGANLSAYYKFDTEGKNTVDDVIGNSSPVKLFNFEFGGWEAGKYGKAVLFNGVNTYGKIERINLSAGDKFSIVFWFSPDRFWGERTIIYCGIPGKTDVLFVEENEDKLVFGIGNLRTIRKYNLNLRLAKNKWYHFGVVVNGDENRFYLFLNGKEIVAKKLPFKFDFSTPVWLGAAGDQKFFSGRLDELKFYSSPLNAVGMSGSMKEEKVEIAIEDYEKLKKMYNELVRKRIEKEKLVEKKRKEEEEKRRKTIAEIRKKEKELNEVLKQLGENEVSVKIPKGKEENILRDISIKLRLKKAELRRKKEEEERRRKEILSKIDKEKERINSILKELGSGKIEFPKVVYNHEEEALEKIIEIRKQKEKELKIKREKERLEAERKRKEHEKWLRKNIEEYKRKINFVQNKINELNRNLGISEEKKVISFGIEGAKGLIGYFKFDTVSKEREEIKNYADGNVKLFLKNMIDSEWVEGKYGKAIDLNGVDSYAVIKNLDLYINNEFTIMLWIRPTRFWGTRKIIYSGSPDSRRGIFSIEIRENILYALAGKGRRLKSLLDKKIRLARNRWSHIIVRVKNGYFDLYYNGRHITSVKLKYPIKFESNMYLGSDSGKTEFLAASIDELKIYNRALSNSEILKGGRELEYAITDSMLEKLKNYYEDLSAKLDEKEKLWAIKKKELEEKRKKLIKEIRKVERELNKILVQLGEKEVKITEIPEGKENAILRNLKSTKEKKSIELKRMLEEKRKKVERLRKAFNAEKNKLSDLLQKLGEPQIIDIVFDETNPEKSLIEIEKKRREKEKIYLKKLETERQRRAYLRKQINERQRKLNSLLKELGEPAKYYSVKEGEEEKILKQIDSEILLLSKKVEEKRRKEEEERRKLRKEITDVRIELIQVLIDLGETPPPEERIPYGKEKEYLKNLKFKLSEAKRRLEEKRKKEEERRQKFIKQIKEEKKKLKDILAKLGEDFSKYDFKVERGAEESILKKIIKIRLEKERDYQFKLEEEKRKKEEERRQKIKKLQNQIKDEIEKLKSVNEKLGISEHIRPITGKATTDKTKDLWAYFKFDEGQGEKISDWSGKEKEIILKSIDVDSWGEGRFGKSVFFNGVSSYGIINLPKSIKPFPPITISMWIYPSRFWGTRTILMINDKESPYGYFKIGVDDNELFVSLKKKGIVYNLKKRPHLFRNNWYHIAIVYNNSLSKLSLYVNGNFVSQIYIDASIRKIEKLMIASSDGTQEFFAGKIDELKIYGKVFTKTEIRELAKEIEIKKISGTLEDLEKFYKEISEKRKKREAILKKKEQEKKKKIAKIKKEIEIEKRKLAEILKKLGEPPIVSVVIKEGFEEEALINIRNKRIQKEEQLKQKIKEEERKRKELIAKINEKVKKLNEVLKKLNEEPYKIAEIPKGKEKQIYEEVSKLYRKKNVVLKKKIEEEKARRQAYLFKIEEAKTKIMLLREKLGEKSSVTIAVPKGKEKDVLDSLNKEIAMLEKRLQKKIEKEKIERRKKFLAKFEEKKRVLYELIDKLGESEKPEFEFKEGEEIKTLQKLDKLIAEKREQYRKVLEERKKKIIRLKTEFLALQEKLNDILLELGEKENKDIFNESTPEESVAKIKQILKEKEKELNIKKAEEKKKMEKLLKEKELVLKRIEEEKQNIMKLVNALGIAESYKFPVEFAKSDEIKKEKLVVYYDFNSKSYKFIPNKALAIYSAFAKDVRKDNWVDGKFGKAFEMNGVSNYIRTKGLDVNIKSGLTLMLWVYPSRFWGVRTIVYLQDTDVMIKIAEEDNRLFLELKNSYQRKLYKNIIKLKKNQWQNIAFSYDDRVKRADLYYNGVKIFERYFENFKFKGIIKTLYIGSSDGLNEFFSGKIDEFRLYNLALKNEIIAKKINTKGVERQFENIESAKIKLAKLEKEKNRLEKEYKNMLERKRKEREKMLQDIENEVAKINDLRIKMGKSADYTVNIKEGNEKQVLEKVRLDRKKVEKEYSAFVAEKERKRKELLARIENEKEKIIELKKKLGRKPEYKMEIIEGYEEDIYAKIKRDRLRLENEWKQVQREKKKRERIAYLNKIEKIHKELVRVMKELGKNIPTVPSVPEGKEKNIYNNLVAKLENAKKELQLKKEKERQALLKKLEKEKRIKLVKNIAKLKKTISAMEKELGVKSVKTLLEEEVVKDASLKIYIKFDKSGGFSAEDSSGFDNTGFIKGTDIYQWEKGKYGNSLSFNGIVGRFEIPASPSFSELSRFTVMMWLYPKRFFSKRTIFMVASKNRKKLIKLYIKEDKVFLKLKRYNDRLTVDTGIKLEKNKWQHLAFSYNIKTTNVNIYFNGRKVSGINTNVKMDIRNRPIILGADIDDEFFAGKIDEFKLFTRILNQDEVVKNMEELIVDESLLFAKMSLSDLEKKYDELKKYSETLKVKLAEKQELEMKKKKAEEERKRILEKERKQLAEKKKKEKEHIAEREKVVLSKEEELKRKLMSLRKQFGKETERIITKEGKTAKEKVKYVFSFDFEDNIYDGKIRDSYGNVYAEGRCIRQENLVDSVKGKGLRISKGEYFKISGAKIKKPEKAFTISFWLKIFDSKDAVILERGNFRIDIKKGKLRINFVNNNKKSLTYKIKKNKWYFVAVSFNSFTGDMKLYINGMEENSNNVNADVSDFYGDLVVGKGRLESVSNFSGIIDEFKLAYKELSSENLVVKIPFNIRITADKKTSKRTVVITLNADNAYQFIVYEKGYKKNARWENMRNKKILILSSTKGKKEIKCMFKSWYGVVREANSIIVDYSKKEPKIVLYSPAEDSVMTGKR